MKKLSRTCWLVFVAFVSCQAPQESDSLKQPVDPLPSWNDGSLKSDIIDYVTRISTEGSPDFVPVADRIATFDNDGTLWAERPYVQELFAIAQAKKMIEKSPNLAKKEPFSAIARGDREYFAVMSRVLELLIATHTGMSEDEFELDAREFFASARYPGKEVPIPQIRYQPQLELLDYLRAHQFSVYICTGGTIEFVRSISADFYGVEPDRVIGTNFKYVFADSSKKVHRQPGLVHFNDKEGKPVSIQLHIGKKPVFACGNEGGAGDIAMLTFCQTNRYPSFQLLINHDDAAREFLYSEADSASLKAAAAGKWHVVSIRDDWKVVFAKQ